MLTLPPLAADWLTAALVIAVLVIAFVTGLRIGRLMEQDAQRARAADRVFRIRERLAEGQVHLAESGDALARELAEYRPEIPQQRRPGGVE